MQIIIKKKTLVILTGIMAGVVALAGLAAWVTYDVYTKRGEGPLVRRIARLLPAARVGPETISYEKFLQTRDTLRIYLNSDAAKEAQLARPVTAEVEKQALDQLLREAAEKELAKERNVTVPDEDVRASFAQIVLSTSSTIPNVAQYLLDSYKWTEEQFRQNVVRPAILEERLAATFSSSTDEQFAMMEGWLAERLAKPDVKKYLKFN